jgi:Peptidase_C39 like family
VILSFLLIQGIVWAILPPAVTRAQAVPDLLADIGVVDENALNNAACGIAAAAMVLDYYRVQPDANIHADVSLPWVANYVKETYHPNFGVGTDFNQLQTGLEQASKESVIGVPLAAVWKSTVQAAWLADFKAELDAKRPLVAFIPNGELLGWNWGHPYGHFIMVSGYTTDDSIVYHDPWLGGVHTLPSAAFAAALGPDWPKDPQHPEKGSDTNAEASYLRVTSLSSTSAPTRLSSPSLTPNTDAAYRAAIADGIDQLKHDVPWGPVWNSIKARFPDRPAEQIDADLGTQWREPGAYERYIASLATQTAVAATQSPTTAPAQQVGSSSVRNIPPYPSDAFQAVLQLWLSSLDRTQRGQNGGNGLVRVTSLQGISTTDGKVATVDDLLSGRVGLSDVVVNVSYWNSPEVPLSKADAADYLNAQVIDGEFAIKDITIQGQRIDVLTPADKANGLTWKGVVEIRFVSQYRVTTPKTPNQVEANQRLPAPTGSWSQWIDESHVFNVVQQRDLWSVIPLQFGSLSTFDYPYYQVWGLVTPANIVNCEVNPFYPTSGTALLYGLNAC